MRFLLLLSLLLPFAAAAAPAQNPAAPAGGAPVSVLGYRWAKSRQPAPKAEATASGPAAAMTPANRNFERNRRINDPAGVRDPNADTIDARSAALEKSVQESRSVGHEARDVFEYRAKVRNDGAKAVEVLFWEYRFAEPSDASNVARRQFLCGVKIRPGKEKELLALTLSAPGVVVSAGGLGERAAGSPQEKVVINRVEYADGTVWQRADWKFAEVRSAVARVTSTPWGGEMCRAL